MATNSELKRTEKGELIISKIDDARLVPGMPRTRSGKTQLFGERIVSRGKLVQDCDFSIEPPEKHFYALEINGVWMWVNGCGHCNQNGEKMTYVVCEEHDRCQGCGVKRKEAVATPDGAMWGSCDANNVWGWTCHPCHEQREHERRQAALARIVPDDEYSESDYWHESEAKCPYCNAEICTDEKYDADEESMECDECGNVFTLTAEHSVSWTTARVSDSEAHHEE
ncbi:MULTISPECIES: hypothetical protein [unclassified Serratia (in: enterobacteria)]|uniref:hypothetical protein n=1 Tax=unclassified Serratia (in: enterobacteria) TaxID=2647522 RepID=UPI000469E7AE|nr:MULTISPECIES: hypothetical protein [unclassified Serratia (in: enterobacteria)]